MNNYRVKAQEVAAVQVSTILKDGENLDPGQFSIHLSLLTPWVRQAIGDGLITFSRSKAGVQVQSLDGPAWAPMSSWIVNDGHGLRVYSREQFASRFETIESGATDDGR